jgi:hypothetical protein
MWWPLDLKSKGSADKQEKVLVLWLNSTLGLLTLLAHRDETEGAWVDFKKPTLKALPVLDVRQLTAGQLKELVAGYDRIAQESLKPLPEMDSDPARTAIDKALCEALSLPDISILRKLLAQEPVICLRRL